jgi:hypothetical protein
MRIEQHYDRDRLDRFQFMKRIVKWADGVGPIIRTALQEEAPVGDPMTDNHAGRLRGSIRYKRFTTPTGIRVDWSAHTPYAPYVIHGTEPHDIDPVAARALRFHDNRTGEWVIRGHAHHPGARANNFPKRAGDRMRGLINQSFRDALKGE